MRDAQLVRSEDGTVLRAGGSWILPVLESRQRAALVDEAGAGPAGTIDCAELDALDTAGAMLLHRLTRDYGGAELRGLRDEFAALYRQVASLVDERVPPPPAAPGYFHRVGEATAQVSADSRRYLSFVGEIAVTALAVLRRPSRLRWVPMLAVFQSAGWSALPILGLLSFLIGIVLAYQAGVQLRDFGANIFIADLIGISVLREFGPLLAAIIVAGRTGSAFTAEIGTMKVTDELDALRTMGVSPLEMLALPKILAMLVVLPLLTVFADLFGILGGMVMAQQMLGVGYNDFLARMLVAVELSDYLTGIGKAPVFALLIASVGCYQGFQVGTSAESVGRHVTRSVVHSLFLILMADATFSVVFNVLGV